MGRLPRLRPDRPMEMMMPRDRLAMVTTSDPPSLVNVWRPATVADLLTDPQVAALVRAVVKAEGWIAEPAAWEEIDKALAPFREHTATFKEIIRE